MTTRQNKQKFNKDAKQRAFLRTLADETILEMRIAYAQLQERSAAAEVRVAEAETRLTVLERRPIGQPSP